MGSIAAKGTEFINGLPFFGGRLWIDLLNTTMCSGGDVRDLIAGPEGISAWLAAAGMAPDGAARGGAEMRELREQLRSTVDVLRIGAPPPAALIGAINAKLAQVSVRLRLEASATGFRLAEQFDAGAAGPCGVIAADFARFIGEIEPERLRRCSNPACTMVFYDTSKNKTRRWCTMAICGNRDKVARFRARKSGQAP